MSKNLDEHEIRRDDAVTLDRSRQRRGARA
jgi:hypothetical protein